MVSPSIGSLTITYEALLDCRSLINFGEDIKVISPSRASLMPETPVISNSGSPRTVPFTIFAKSFAFIRELFFLNMKKASFISEALDTKLFKLSKEKNYFLSFAFDALYFFNITSVRSISFFEKSIIPSAFSMIIV